MAERPVVYATAFFALTLAHALYGGVALLRALDGSSASGVERAAFIVAAAALLVTSAYMFAVQRALKARRLLELNTTSMACTLIIVSLIDVLVVSLGTGAVIHFEHALVVVAALAMLVLAWYAVATLPHVHRRRAAP